MRCLRLVDVIGYDVGGANTKAVWMHTENGSVTLRSASQYFPVWKEPEKLDCVFLELKERLDVGSLDAIGITMTAELSDAYKTKREGVHHILNCLKEAFPATPLYVLDSNADLVSIQQAKQNPLSVASANWAATGWLISKKVKNSIVIDVGSTSTSIIPVLEGKLVARGKTDLDKLICGELIYTGSLRTNVATIVQKIAIRGSVAGLSSELFATSGDIHLLLGHISSTDFTSETADGRGKSIKEAMARLSRIICADIDMLTRKEIIDLAEFIYQKQLFQIRSGLTKVYEYLESKTNDEIVIVVTGLGYDFLARKAAEQMGVNEIISIDVLFSKEAVLATPAVGVACLTANKIEGAPIKWP